MHETFMKQLESNDTNQIFLDIVNGVEGFFYENGSVITYFDIVLNSTNANKKTLNPYTNTFAENVGKEFTKRSIAVDNNFLLTCDNHKNNNYVLKTCKLHLF